MEGENNVSGFWDNVTNFFFKNEDDDSVTEEDTIQLEEPIKGAVRSDPALEKRSEQRPAVEKKAKKSNLIAVPSRKSPSDNLEIVLFKASSYDDMQDIARHIKERKVAVVNFEEMDKDVAQRMVDFLSGAVFALDGKGGMEPADMVSSGGESPRDFDFLPGGRMAAATNEFTDNVVFFDYGARNGRLARRGPEFFMPNPLNVFRPGKL